MHKVKLHKQSRRIAFGTVASAAIADSVRGLLREQGWELIDLPVAQSDDLAWPEVGRRVADLVAAGEAATGVAMCWTGSGVAISASAVPGIRAAYCAGPTAAIDARQWHDANILGLSLQGDAATVLATVRAWLATQPLTDLPHQKARIRLAAV
jgi:ribose 5-phosphate isomerase B